MQGPTPVASSVTSGGYSCWKGHGITINRCEVRLALIQAEIGFNVFRELPDGYGGRSGRVVRLNESVHGLKQAGRSWAVRLGDVLV